MQLASTALVGLGEGARYLVDYPFGCAEQKASAGLALALAADLGQTFAMGRVAPADDRGRAAALLADLPRYQCGNGGFGYWPGACTSTSVYLTSYLLHVMRVADGLGIATDRAVIDRALDYLEANCDRPRRPPQIQWLPVWAASQAFGVKVLAEYGRNQDSNITRLVRHGRPAAGIRPLLPGRRHQGQRHHAARDMTTCVRRLTNALRIEGDQAHAEEIVT